MYLRGAWGGIKWLVKSKPILKKGMGFLFFGALRLTLYGGMRYTVCCQEDFSAIKR
jgi:hypothetical protein